MRLTETVSTFDLSLSSGVTVTLRPLDGPLYFSSQMASANRAAGDEEWPEGLDRKNDSHRLGVGLSLMAQEVARLAVVSWSGVEEEDGSEAACTPDNVARLVRLFPHDGETIRRAVTQRAAPAVVEAGKEGNDSAPV